MKKSIKIILIIALVIVVLIVGGLFYFLNATNTRTAFLKVGSGEVQVDFGNGWESASNDMKLGVSDKIKTLEGTAKIVLFESVIISLDPFTEISVKELSEEYVSIKQDTGSTWNKFTGLSGIKNYEVETPKTVATVRGTEFGVSIDEVIVAEGKVYVKSSDQTLEIVGGKKAVVDADGNLIEKELDSEDIGLITKKDGADLGRTLRQLRLEEINKHSMLIEQARKKYNFTDQDILTGLKKIDSGELNDRELLEQSPVKVAAADKVIELNDKIKEQQVAIKSLR